MPTTAAKKVDVTKKLQATAARIAKLAPAKRASYRAKLDALESKVGTPSVAGTSRPGTFPGSKPAQPKKTGTSKSTALTLVPKPAKVEWDLVFANELDKIYTAVSDRVTEVRKDSLNAAADAAAPVAVFGFGFWPLAIAAVAIVWALNQAKR
jgi:hypothetical protein